MSRDEKLNLFKLHKAEYVAPKKPTLVDVRRAQYLAISGTGAPGGEAFGAAIGALYAVAFTIKMTRKFAGKGDYVIGKREGQYWAAGSQKNLQEVSPDRWRWRLMIRTPDSVTGVDLREALGKLLERSKGPEVKNVELVSLEEGACIQMLHVGPYERQRETVGQMLAFAKAEGLQASGRHHDVYLSDPRRVTPERLRTIVRIPVTRRG